MPSAELFTYKWVGLPLGVQSLFTQPALTRNHSSYLTGSFKGGGEIVKVMAEKRVSITLFALLRISSMLLISNNLNLKWKWSLLVTLYLYRYIAVIEILAYCFGTKQLKWVAKVPIFIHVFLFKIQVHTLLSVGLSTIHKKALF